MIDVIYFCALWSTKYNFFNILLFFVSCIIRYWTGHLTYIMYQIPAAISSDVNLEQTANHNCKFLKKSVFTLTNDLKSYFYNFFIWSNSKKCVLKIKLSIRVRNFSALNKTINIFKDFFREGCSRI
jgi:hypothetical protein